uniref:GrpE protein homolog n=1 Tax=Heliothis virescens TaxID=7102 RepID=A0A2A4JSC2_HELVI
MASLNVYSVGRLAKYVAGSPLRTLRANVYRSAVCRYSTEEKASAEPEVDNKQLPGTVEECHKHIESLTAEVNTLRTQVKDFEDKYKRALADGENVRRRMMKQVEDAKSFAIQSFCKDLLDAHARTAHAGTDSQAHARTAHAGTDSQAHARTAHAGTDSQVADTLAAAAEGVFSRHGLVSVSPLREKFDPNLHEALFQQEVEGAEAGTVVAVSKVGYKLHERCVRPALVGVAK